MIVVIKMTHGHNSHHSSYGSRSSGHHDPHQTSHVVHYDSHHVPQPVHQVVQPHVVQSEIVHPPVYEN
jgi:hypothetical protein